MFTKCKNYAKSFASYSFLCIFAIDMCIIWSRKRLLTETIFQQGPKDL